MITQWEAKRERKRRKVQKEKKPRFFLQLSERSATTNFAVSESCGGKRVFFRDFRWWWELGEFHHSNVCAEVDFHFCIWQFRRYIISCHVDAAVQIVQNRYHKVHTLRIWEYRLPSSFSKDSKVVRIVETFWNFITILGYDAAMKFWWFLMALQLWEEKSSSFRWVWSIAQHTHQRSSWCSENKE